MAHPARQTRRLARSRLKGRGRGRRHPGQSHVPVPSWPSPLPAPITSGPGVCEEAGREYRQH